MDTVLLVEDEDSVRRVIKAILQRSGGYRVIETTNADEALKYYAEHPADVQLVLTDVVMPGMSGIDLASKLRGQYPGIKVICMSGFPKQVDLAGFDFLAKPLEPDVLISKVQEVLTS